MLSKRKRNNIDMIYVIYIICIILFSSISDNMSIEFLWLFIIMISISVSSMAFILFQRLVKAKWSERIEEIAKSVAMSLPATIFILVYFCFIYMINYAFNENSNLFLEISIYKFSNPFLNYYYSPLLFTVRILLYYTVWLFVLYKINKNEIKSGLYFTIILFCLSFFGIDVVLGVGSIVTDFFWYSSVFGIYFIFSGLVATISYIIILYLCFEIKHNDTIKYNLGKILFTLNLLWAYTAFSQYLIILYGNLSVELNFYDVRFSNNWEYISLFIFLFHFVFPFLLLLPKKFKTHNKILFISSFMIIIAFIAEVYWLIYPIYYPTILKFGIDEIFALFMIISLFILLPVMKLKAKYPNDS